MAAKGITVDLNKPLVFQVSQLGDDYEEWINKPILSKEGPRFFANPFLEFLTRTAWWVVPLVWLPVATWFVLESVNTGLAPTELTATFLTGFFGWTLMEYTLHRFFFHRKLKGYWGNTFHYLLHGCHHKHPMDSLRLVFPPAGAAILASIRNHMDHHFRYHDSGYGITSNFWDRLFGTLPPQIM
ncbi:dihydroceramide fatty acyl 2-hydroxylase FAH1-like isoform X1 [Apium graveolens]|uniref:dihydroceramide fatty acyl 2-hydroxylase FAH1-like isoform X1 n=1 Tax=Apium graveolens TaxID=4045 RepID=UPI003D796E08